ncbi:hypothetical protein D3C71_1702660 [compost metagenome]
MQFARGQAATGGRLVAFGDGFAQVFLALLELFAGNVDRGVQFGVAGLPRVALHFHQPRRLRQDFLGRHEGLAGGQRLEAGRLGQQRQVLGIVFAQ